MKLLCQIALVLLPCCSSFSPKLLTSSSRAFLLKRLAVDEEWTSDFDDFIGDDGDESLQVSSIYNNRAAKDLSAIATRQFSLGKDVILVKFIGNMGFDEVTDWEYYYENEDDPTDRKVVQPNLFDASQPKRTRSSSGSVVRVFSAELVGTLGAVLSSQGLDKRVMLKEFTGDLALQLAYQELQSVGRLQSDLLADNQDAVDGWWVKTASFRSSASRQDDSNVAVLSRTLSQSPFLGILGEISLAELDGEMEANDFYRALGVPPPKPGAVWVLYEWAGLSTVSSYAQPPVIRRSRLPLKKTFFGVSEPPALPPWRERANYVVKGIMKGAVEALATLHESGIAHRSLGRSSLVLSSTTQDKIGASSVYATRVAATGLVVKLSDFGFSGLLEDSTQDEEFLARARSFGLNFRKGENSLASKNFAMAEDLHALGFVFLGLLLTALAELRSVDYPMPATDEDTLQRLLGEIFSKDMREFREYVEAEEEVWGDLVAFLDENDASGWNLLEVLFTAREIAAENKNSLQAITARGLLANPIFQ